MAEAREIGQKWRKGLFAERGSLILQLQIA
jgi:hypothetical protein